MLKTGKLNCANDDDDDDYYASKVLLWVFVFVFFINNLCMLVPTGSQSWREFHPSV